MNHADTSFRRLRGLVGAFTLLLMGVTWPLWWEAPATASPRIPWFEFLISIPGLVDVIALAVLVIGSCGWMVAVWNANSRIANVSSALYFIGLAALVALDQHRLQPWVIQYLLFGAFALLARGEPFLRGWKWVIAGIYIWSAISKFDATFFTHQGQLFLNGLLDPLGIDHAFWSPQFKHRLAMLFPVGELMAGILLLIPRTRRWGLLVSILMHLVLVWILAFGLKHEWAVLLWNPFFILQNLIVFGPDVARRQATSPSAASSVSTPLYVRGFVLLAVLYPALEPLGWCDHWPAWAVYCARPAQVRVLIQDELTENLPDDLKKHLGLPAPLDDRLPLNLDGWCFQRRFCPIYPQERYRLALALALLREHLPAEAVTVEIRSTPDRWTGNRPLTTLNGTGEIEQACRQFRLNTKPR